MVVLHLVKTSDGGGWAYREMRELVSLGVEVHVAMPVGGRWTDLYQRANIQIHDIDFCLKHIFSTCKQLKEIVSAVQPDIIQSHFVVTTLFMRLALRNDRRPRIFKVPGPLHLENWFFRNLELLLSQETDYWVGSCSWTNKRYEKSGINKDRLFLCFYGGDENLLKKSDKKDVIRKELNLDTDAFIIGMVAYMYAPKKYLGQRRGIKGHEDFIDAIAIVSQKYPQVHGVCIGGAWGNALKYEASVRKYAEKKTDHVHLLGSRDDVPDLYNDMQLVVHPSHSENLGGAGESLSYGVPTLATNIGGFPDLIIDGKTGLLIPAKDPQSMAKKIIDCIEGRYDLRQFVENGYDLIKKVSGVRMTAQKMKAVYEEILDRNMSIK